VAKFLNLDDVEKTAKQHPETFFIPSEAERRTRKDPWNRVTDWTPPE
jgi:hypothetical protein